MTAGTISTWLDAGDALRTARQASGITLDDLAGRTCIASWHLEAIEDSRFDALPAPIFAVGFAKSFARAVGLPEEPIAAAVRHGLDERRQSTRSEAQGADRQAKGVAGLLAAAVAAVALILFRRTWGW